MSGISESRGPVLVRDVEEVEVDNLLPVLPWLCVDVCDLRDS